MSDSVNTATWEFNAFVTPDENVIFFTSFGRSDDMGGGDLYASVKVNGNWTQAVHLDNVNTSGLDYCPFLDEKNGAFYYTSDASEIKPKYDSALTFSELQRIMNEPKNGNGNIYWVNAVTLNLR